MKNKILFISSIVPDKKKYWNDAFTRSGNNVLLGIAKGLTRLGADIDIFSCRPTPSYPQTNKLWHKKEYCYIDDDIKIELLPTLNLKFIKNIYWGVYIFVFLIKWKVRNRDKRTSILVYNIYCPPSPFLYVASKLLNIRLNIIFYDLGVPPKSFKLGYLSMLAYRVSEWFVTYIMKRIDGRIIINESIIEHYAPNSDYLFIDGGINEHIISRLFPLRISQNKEYVFLCAGMLWEQNGTKLILEAMKRNLSPNIRVVFAGKGLDVPLIQKAEIVDSRIKYKGMLSMDELFLLYEEADVLLNLRIEEEVDFHFPSKLLEYMVTGKYVVSTPIAHAERDYGAYLSILRDISSDGLAEKMNEIMLLSKEELYSTGKKARQYMLEYRNWNIRSKNILDYLSQ